MAEFAYNNAKNSSTSYTSFKFNDRYHSYKVLFKKDIKPHLKSCFANKQAEKLKKLVLIDCQNLFYKQKL